MKKLAEWLEKKCIKQKGLAKVLNISQANLCEIIKGKIPSLKTAYAIEIFTEGHITLYDWVDESKCNTIKPKTTKKVNKK